MKTKELNKDVLKRTQGLLSQIDTVLRAPSIAERVERVLSSAAPQINVAVFPTYEDWEKSERYENEEFEDWEEQNELADHDFKYNNCGCDHVPVTQAWFYPDSGESFESEIAPRACSFDHLGRYDAEGSKVDLFDFINVRIVPSFSGGKAADQACGVSGCECEDLFPPLTTCIHCNAWVSPARLDWSACGKGPDNKHEFHDWTTDASDSTA